MAKRVVLIAVVADNEETGRAIHAAVTAGGTRSAAINTLARWEFDQYFNNAARLFGPALAGSIRRWLG